MPTPGVSPKGEAAENGIQRSFPEHTAPGSNGRDFQLQGEQVGAQHTGREPWFWSEDRITFLHDGISGGEIKIEELNDIIPSVLRKGKRIRIKFEEFGYESILIGGMAAGITR